ncbi:MAG: hypothetical protein IKG42_03455 [Clostridia bacterium]|nr:hypothetical protein [Clostridia bacterium]
MIKKIFVMVLILSGLFIIFLFQNNSVNDIEIESENEIVNNEISNKEEELVESQIIIELKRIKNSNNYSFIYDGEEFIASYSNDNWHITDSYKIKDNSDIIVICQALIDCHPIHGSDMVSYRTAEDMAYEWIQHNIAYEFLPENSSWKNNTKDVDLNPEDQGKSFLDMYRDRIK